MIDCKDEPTITDIIYMRTVFRIKGTNNSQGVVALDEEISLNGSPREINWSKPRVQITGPNSMKPDFFGNAFSGLVFGQSVYDETYLWGLMEQSGEILELSHPRERLFLLNITYYPEPLDEDRCGWSKNPATGEMNIVSRFEFRLDRLPYRGFFRMNCDDGLFLATDSNNGPQDDFYQWYHHLGLKGLGFQKIWERA